MISGVMKNRLGSLVCLAALLALTILPLVHQCHLHGLEKLHPHQAAGLEHTPGLNLSAPEPDEPEHSHHDATTCPICQAASLCRYFSAPTLAFIPVSALPILRFCDKPFTSLTANACILTAGPRAPPASL